MANPELWDGSLLKKDQPKPEKPLRNSGRRKPLPKASVKQKLRTAFLHGVKAERLHDQQRSRTAYAHPYVCEGSCDLAWDTWEEAWMALTLHHTVKRSKGHGYVDWADFGVDEPRLLILVCESCHQALESNPEWSKSA